MSLAGAKAGSTIAVGSLMRKLRLSGDSESDVLRREAQSFVDELGRLKGSYVKIGQLLAQFGEHFLPVELTEALHTLGSDTEAMPFNNVEPVLRHSLGARYAQLDVEPKAMAAASLAQVHAANWQPPTVKGRPSAAPQQLCLKVLYPGLRDSIDSDFDTVIRMLKLGRFLQMNRQMQQWLEKMRAQLKREADYRHEAQMTLAMAERVQSLSDRNPGLLTAELKVPRLEQSLCQGDVLALERMHGFAVNSPQVQRLSKTRRSALGKAMLELFFAEVFEWGLIQTDPNFGNYLIKASARLRGANSQPDQLILLDFGSVDTPTEEFLESLRTAISCGLANDEEGLRRALVMLGCLQPNSSASAQQSFAQFCIAILEPLRPPAELPASCLNERGEYCWADSKLVKRVGKQAATASLHKHFELPSAEFTLIARKLIGVFTFISVLRSEFNGHEIAARYVTAWEQGNADKG